MSVQGSASALVVKWADTEKERQARKVQKAQAVSSPPIPGQQPSIFGAVPMGYVPAPPPYNGYSYQVRIFASWLRDYFSGIFLEFDYVDEEHNDIIYFWAYWLNFCASTATFRRFMCL